MSVEQITDAERQLLVVLVTKAWVEIRSDVDMMSEALELEGLLRKINGVDKRISVENAS
jgi:hypothetical protein